MREAKELAEKLAYDIEAEGPVKLDYIEKALRAAYERGKRDAAQWQAIETAPQPTEEDKQC